MIRMGDIGASPEEYEILPEYQPFEVPEVAPSEEPEREAVPA